MTMDMKAAYIEANSPREAARADVPKIVRMQPYTRATGPPLSNPA